MSDASRFAYDPEDSEEVRLEKRVILLIAASCCVCGTIWCLMYWLIFGWGLIAFWPGLFVVVVGSAMAISHFTRKHRVAVWAQILCIVYVTLAIQWSIGGIFDSGFVMLWSFIGPVAALIFFSPKRALIWFGVFLVNVVVTVVFDDTISTWGPGTDPEVRRWFFLMNMGIGAAVVFAFAGYFMINATRERNRAEGLLLNILPREIAPRLKAGQKTIADHYDSASVLFADMVGSTPLFAGMSAEQTVAWLNEVFTLFDRLIERHGLEKIRTIGDNYMVAAGVPRRRPDHAKALVALALDMVDAVADAPARDGKRMQFRFGIHTGPLVAGVIGETKFQYDLWGDTVNVAARMESHGEVGRVQVSAATHALVRDAFECEHRGQVAIKGKGEMETYFVTRKNEFGPN